MLDLKALLTKVLGCCYIKGTSGNWTYKKYLDGTLECWYKGVTGTYTVGTQRGTMYSGGWITYSFPVAFNGVPVVTASANLTTDAYVVLAQTRSPNADNVMVRITAGSSIAANPNYLIAIHAIGTWGGVIESIKRFLTSLSSPKDWGWVMC